MNIEYVARNLELEPKIREYTADKSTIRRSACSTRG